MAGEAMRDVFIRVKMDTKQAQKNANLLDKEIDDIIKSTKTMSATQVKAASKQVRALRTARQEYENIAKSADKATDSQFSFFAGLGIGFATIQFGKQSIALAADRESLKVSMTAMLQGNEQLANSVINTFQRISDVTPFVEDEIFGVGKQLIGLQVPIEKLEPTIKRIGDIAAGSGNRIADLSLIYGQVMAKGRLQGEEMMQLMERQVPIVQALSDHFGVAKSEISDMASKGLISFEEFDKALEKMRTGTGLFAGQMEKLSRTSSGMWSTLVSNVQRFQRSVGTMLLQIAAPVLRFFTNTEKGANRTKIAILALGSALAVGLVRPLMASGAAFKTLVFGAKAANIAMTPLMLKFAAMTAGVLLFILILEDLYLWLASPKNTTLIGRMFGDSSEGARKFITGGKFGGDPLSEEDKKRLEASSAQSKAARPAQLEAGRRAQLSRDFPGMSLGQINKVTELEKAGKGKQAQLLIQRHKEDKEAKEAAETGPKASLGTLNQSVNININVEGGEDITEKIKNGIASALDHVAQDYSMRFGLGAQDRA